MTMSGKRVPQLVLGFACLVALLLYTLPSNYAYAAQITSRKLTLQDRSGVGGSTAGGAVNHQFEFTLPGGTTVGSIKFEYCTTPSGPSNPSCTAPAGLTTASATLGTSTGVVFSSAVSDSANVLHVTRTAASIGTNVAVVTQLLNVTNPNNTTCFGGTAPQSNNCTFYVRISTYASTNATGSADDTGSVAASTATQITLSGYMPESLIFCTGGNITTTSGVPDCSTATSGSISFNQPFSPSDTATAISKMAASTNAATGYNITYSGPTLTSGSNTVSPMSSSTTGVRGTSQFGLNVVANTTTTSTVAVGANVNPANNGTNYRGAPSTGYGTADTFKFTTAGDTVAKSDNGTASFGPTDIQIFTVSYIVNANGAQAVGTYTTTLTYVCTATY
jgi:hypothetical protein